MITKDQSGWYCPCEYRNRTGIPCYHLIKILMDLKKDPILSSIANQWLVPEEILSESIVTTALKSIRLKRGPSK